MSNRFFVICMLCISCVVFARNDYDTLNDNNELNEKRVQKLKDDAEYLELIKRKEIVKKYLNSLENGKENWVDPNDMINVLEGERQPFINDGSSSLHNEPSVNDDNLQTFSDSKRNTKRVSGAIDNAADLEIKRRKQIVNEYLNTLEGETTDNPNDLIDSESLISNDYKKNNGLQTSNISKRNTKQVTSSKDNAAAVEIKKRKEIAKKYLDSLEKGKETWINPFDMIGDHIAEYQPETTDVFATLSAPDESSEYNNYDSLFDSNNGEVISSSIGYKSEDNLFTSDKHKCSVNCAYISRWFKKLISKIEGEPDFEPLSIPLSSEFIDDLKTISDARTLEISELDENICNLIEKLIVLKQKRFSWTNLIGSFYESIFDTRFMIFIGVCLSGYIFHKCLKHRPFFTMMWCVIFVSVGWHWMHLYQKQVAIKHSKLTFGMPHECRKSEFGLFEHIYSYIKSFFATNDCKEYYEALMVDPVWEVSLTVAISETLAAMFFQPLYSGSKALNQSVKQLFHELPIFHALILVIFLFLVVVMYNNYKIRLPLFMGTIEPSHVRHNYVEDVQPTRPYNILRDGICRAFSSLQESQPNSNITLRLESPNFNNVNDFKADHCISKCESVKSCKTPFNKSKHKESVSRDDCCIPKCKSVTNSKISFNNCSEKTVNCIHSNQNISEPFIDCNEKDTVCIHSVANINEPFNECSKKETVCIHSVQNINEHFNGCSEKETVIKEYEVEEKKPTFPEKNLNLVKRTTDFEGPSFLMGSSAIKPQQNVESDIERNANTCENISATTDSTFMVEQNVDVCEKND